MKKGNKPIRKIRVTAKGISYTGFASHWRCDFGDVIIIAENLEAVATVSNKMQQLKAHQFFDRDLCPKVAVFQMTDVEVSGEANHVVP